MKIFKKTNDGYLKKYYLFGQRVWTKKTPLLTYRDTWRAVNRHNDTFPAKPLDTDKITVGIGTYGVLDVESFSNDNSRLRIGNYVSIGPDVHFILASEHPYTGFSTYPFKVKFGLQKREATSKGDIIVDDDVWIGLGAIICSGVHIGQGAIIAAGSVVVKNVEPYAIVGGNPAKLIKYRFESEIREKLLHVDFSKLDKDQICKNIDLVYTPLTTENIDHILQTLTGGNQ